jgi:hypothetical protein
VVFGLCLVIRLRHCSLRFLIVGYMEKDGPLGAPKTYRIQYQPVLDMPMKTGPATLKTGSLAGQTDAVLGWPGVRATLGG